MAFYIGKHLTFIDSFQFMSQSLDKLSGNLPEDQFIYTNDAFQGQQFTLMKKKGVYPYDYMDSHRKFQEAQLPKKEDFYSLLLDEDISDDEYHYAKKSLGCFSD